MPSRPTTKTKTKTTTPPRQAGRRDRTGELRRLNAALNKEIRDHRRDARARDDLALIVESSHDGILSRDIRNIVLSWNKGAERLFGYTAAEVLGRTADFLVPRELQEELRQADQRVRGGEWLAPFETVHLRKDGTRVDLWLALSAIKGANGRVCGIASIARDMSARKKAANALQESEARLRAIMDNSPAIIFLKSRRGRYLHVNRGFTEAFRLSTDQVTGKTDEELFPSEQAARFRAQDLKVLASPRAMTFHELIEQRNGPRRGLVARFPLFDVGGHVQSLGGIITDVTERERLEEEIVRISEYEQQRIAQDLHDGLGQQLAGTWFLSDTLRKALAAQSSSHLPTMEKIVQLLETAVNQVRDLARGLLPVSAEPNGLMAALHELAVQSSELFAVACRYVCPQPVLVHEAKVASHLYRIAQEAISNAIRHGKAKTVHLDLRLAHGKIQLRIADNGAGFSTAKQSGKGLGLQTMKYRAGLIGAEFTIKRRAVGGTEVVCRLPNASGRMP